jgi:hypothetical protein
MVRHREAAAEYGVRPQRRGGLRGIEAEEKEQKARRGFQCPAAARRSPQTRRSMYAIIPAASIVGTTTALIFRYMELPPERKNR